MKNTVFLGPRPTRHTAWPRATSLPLDAEACSLTAFTTKGLHEFTIIAGTMFSESCPRYCVRLFMHQTSSSPNPRDKSRSLGHFSASKHVSRHGRTQHHISGIPLLDERSRAMATGTRDLRPAPRTLIVTTLGQPRGPLRSVLQSRAGPPA